MTLRKKTLIIVGLTLVGLFAILYLTLSSIFLSGFAQVETQDTQRNVQRVLNALDDEINKLAFTAQDWGAWDDTYNFIEDENEQYRTGNLTKDVFARLKYNLILYVHISGRIVFGASYDVEAHKVSPIPESIQPYLTTQGILARDSTPLNVVKGILLLPEGILIFGSKAILRSDNSGPARGTLTMGRYLNESAVRQLAERTHLTLTVHRLNEGATPSDFMEARSSISDKTPIVVRPLSEALIAGYTSLSDIYGKPALMLRVDIPRAVHSQSQASLRWSILSLIVMVLLFVILTLVMLERLVLAPLSRLSAGVSRIGAMKDLSMRVSMLGKDELANLAETINKMLQALQDSHKREERLSQELQELRIEVDHAKKARQVAEITETDYFQQLQKRANELRAKRSSS